MIKETNSRSGKSVLDCVHHLSFAVRDLESAIERFQHLLGVAVSERGPVPSRKAEVAIFRLRNLNIEVVAPSSADSTLHAHLDRHGEGFFHIAFAVEDVDAVRSELQRAGIGMAGDSYIAYKDWRVAYLDPNDTVGIAMHLINADAE